MTDESNTFIDVDIDVASGTNKSAYGVRGMIYNQEYEQIAPHPSAYYINPTQMPIDPETGLAAIDYQDATAHGFHKVDLLTNGSYDVFDSKDDLNAHIAMDPDWSLLQEPSFVERLPHIHQHFDFVSQFEVESAEDLADVLALMRPGKQHLVEQYKRNKEKTRKNLYKRPPNGQYYFKKSHAVSYALLIIAVMNKTQKDNPKTLFGLLSSSERET